MQRAKHGATGDFLHKNLTTTQTECLLWPFGRDAFGYGRAFVNGYSSRLAHRVMCEMRHGPPDPISPHVRHLCGMGHKGCVNPNHLLWGTPSENSADKERHGTKPLGSTTGLAKLCDVDVKNILHRRAKGDTYKSLAEAFGVSLGTIQAIAERRTWRHVTLTDA
jgi:hypothetical protein